MTQHITVSVKTVDRDNKEKTYFWTVDEGDYVGTVQTMDINRDNVDGGGLDINNVVVEMTVQLVSVKLDLLSLFDSIMKNSSDLKYKVSIAVNGLVILDKNYSNVHASINLQNHKSELVLVFNDGI